MSKYIKINAKDFGLIEFNNVILNIETGEWVDGMVIIYEGDEEINYKYSDIDKVNDREVNLFAKVVDTGTYELLDENMNPVKKLENFYVPKILERFNTSNGYGDYLEFILIRKDDKLFIKLGWKQNDDIESLIMENRWIDN